MTKLRGILLAGAVVPILAVVVSTSAMAAPKLVNGVWYCDTNVRCPPNKIPKGNPAPAARAPAAQAPAVRAPAAQAPAVRAPAAQAPAVRAPAAQAPAARAPAAQAPTTRAPLAQNGVQQQKAQQAAQQKAQQAAQAKAQAEQQRQLQLQQKAQQQKAPGAAPGQLAPAAPGIPGRPLTPQQIQQQKAQQLQQQKLQQMQQQKAMQQQKLQQMQQQKAQQIEQRQLQMQQKQEALKAQQQRQLEMQQQKALQIQQQRQLGAGGQQRPQGGQQGVIGGQGNGQFQQPIGAGTGPYGRPPVAGAPIPGQPMPGGFRRESRGIGAAGAAAIGVGVGAIGGYMLSNQIRGGVTEVRTYRENYTEGNVRYVREPGRIIIREEGGPAFIRHNEAERFAVLGYKSEVINEGGNIRTIYERPGGVRLINVTDSEGRLMRRIRRYPDGREVIIIDNTFRARPQRHIEQVVVLPPPPLMIPRDRYVVDASVSDEATIYEALTAPPLSRMKRRYTLDEVRYSADLRAQMRSVDINAITFTSGSWEIEQSQITRLSTIAAAINKAIEANAEEVFLIEGHTDAVGDQDDNLSLSDRRAQSVAEILSRDFNIPAENLTTQGYGEAQLRVQTDGAVRENRRVTIRRVTPLISNNCDCEKPQ